MKIFKAIIMSIGIAAAAMTASAQDASVIQDALNYTGKEWCIIPMDEDYNEKIYSILSEKNGGSFAKIIVPEYDDEKITTLIVANANVEDAETLTITIGDEEYSLRKTDKGQETDTYLAKYASAIPSNINIFAKLYFNNMKSATLIAINRKFPSILEVYSIKVEIGNSTFTFAPDFPIK